MSVSATCLHTSEVRGWQWCGCEPRPDRRPGAACADRRRDVRDLRRSVTPAPPQAWIASSMTFSAMRGAATLIIAISRARPCCDLVHHVGGFQAKQTTHFDIGARFADALLPDRVLKDLLAERFARPGASHRFQRLRGCRWCACSDGYGPDRDGPVISKPRPSPSRSFRPARSRSRAGLRRGRAAHRRSRRPAASSRS